MREVNIKKISFLIQNLIVGGAENVIINLANQMSNNNFKVSIIVIGNVKNLEHRLNKSIINIYYLNNKRSAYSIFKIRKVIKEINPDYIFSSISHLNLML